MVTLDGQLLPRAAVGAPGPRELRDAGGQRPAVQRGDAAAERVLTTLRFFYQLPQGPAATGTGGYHGFFYHFLDPISGFRFQTVELSTVDTALLLAGVLFCQQYFDRAGGFEPAIRAYADSLATRLKQEGAQPASNGPIAIESSMN